MSDTKACGLYLYFAFCLFFLFFMSFSNLISFISFLGFNFFSPGAYENPDHIPSAFLPADFFSDLCSQACG